ncbi:class I SAM-dependent methyltransferase [Desulfogranum marinum]|uniref:class I SAM-dependent methyltransferase n=1 Tax=Desulfogranum marinum TaxID=453220 RepID=UPI00196584B0|nr:class I SAM-dependent methyltransferase [Desulfogranum marinum]
MDPASFLTPLARFLTSQSTILDIGCGSGRDLLWLAERGFKVTRFEQSAGLANLARKHAGCPVIEGDFCDFDFSSLVFDALVLVGTLVHQPRSAMHAVLVSLTTALQPGGYMLITMKQGTGSYSLPDGRQFTLWGKEEVGEVYRSCGLRIVDSSR